jgi:predicted outer membrane repeat protein
MVLFLAATVPLRAVPENELRTLHAASVDFSQAADGDGKLLLSFDGSEYTLSVKAHSLRGSDFVLFVQEPNGFVEYTPPAANTYRGFIDGFDASQVALQETNGRVRVVMRFGQGDWWFVEPIERGNAAAGEQGYVVYQRGDVLQGAWNCGSAHAEGAGAISAEHAVGAAASVAGVELRVADLAVDTDVEFFQLNGSSVAATLADIENIVNGVSLLYEQEAGIAYELTTVVIRTGDVDSDPYSSTHHLTLLEEFRNTWNSSMLEIHRDVAHLMTGKEIDANIIGVAHTGTMCEVCTNAYGYGLSQSRFSTLMSKRVVLTAHEIGHNWGADHCDGNPNCGLMCSALNGCARPSDDFGVSLPIISSAAANAACVTTVGPGPTLPFCETFDSGLSRTAWSFIAGAETVASPVAAPSPPNVLSLDRCCNDCVPAPDEVRSNTIDLSGVGPVQVAYWTRYAGSGTGSQLVIEYRNSAGYWSQLHRIAPSDAAPDVFTRWAHDIPVSGLHDAFRLRFRMELADDFDAWHVDNVAIGSGVPDSEVVRVREGVQSAGGGDTWDSAFGSVSDALAMATCSGQLVRELWVAEGTYQPAGAQSDRAATFRVPRGMALYGGFGGFEEERDHRDPQANPTVLSGETGLPNNLNDNLYHVVTITNGDAETIIDGFTVTGGDATTTPTDGGGGVRVIGGSPTIANCLFEDNRGSRGGAVAVSGSAFAAIESSFFIGNSAVFNGGALYVASGSNVQAEECRFLGNVAAQFGGAVYTDITTAGFSDCALGGNHAVSGGAVYVQRGFVTLSNCTIYENTASSSVGGVLSANAGVPLDNCILWANSDSSGETAQAQAAGAGLNVNYSCVQGYSGAGVGNIALDPSFVDADGADDQPGTPDDDLRITAASPARDSGNPAVEGGPGVRDLLQHPRVLCGQVDMGAIEFGLADADCNGIVAPDDFGSWAQCAAGPDAFYAEPDCAGFDFNVDGRLDLVDFQLLQHQWPALVGE